ncbi:glycosyltransferase family 4 protein [Pseudooceanicola sp. C21-150M6]
MPKLLINGRFLAGEATAVNAVARDLSRALIEAPGRWDIALAIPPGLADTARDLGLPARVTGTRDGIAWEQRDLPRLRKEAVIAGFFNTVPLIGSGYVTMLHDAHVFTTPASYSLPTRLWRQLLSRRAGAAGNYVCTISDYSRDSLLTCGIGSPDRLAVVPNGIGGAGLAAPDRTVLDRLGLTGRDFVVGLSSLLPHKNIGVLLQAFADPALADMQLVLFGKADRAAFEAAGHSIPDNVTFAGFVSDAELAALYDAAVAACIPSTEEGFGLPALESMAHGTPAIVAPCAALPEVVGQTGLYASATDPGEWVAAIRRLAGEEPGLRASLSEQAKERAEGFSWAASARAFLTALDGWFPA